MCIFIIFISSFSQSSGPVHSLPLIHGKAGVSHLSLHNNTMYSAGRDGVYRQLRIQNNTLEVIDTKKVFLDYTMTHMFSTDVWIQALWLTRSSFLQVFKGLDWVERLLFSNSGDLLIAGFHSVRCFINRLWCILFDRETNKLTVRSDDLFCYILQAYFVLWSVQRSELLWRVKCGGAHRVWDLALEQSVSVKL